MAEAHYNLGLIYGPNGQNTEALLEFQEALRITPNDPAIYGNLGIVYGQLGRPEDEVRAYKESIRRDPDNAQVHHNLSVTYSQVGRLNEAIAEAEISAHLGFPGASRHLVELREQQAKKQPQEIETKPREQKTLPKNPISTIDTNAEVERLVNAGVRLKRQQDFVGAKSLYLEAIKIDTTSHMATWALAKICYLLGEREEAILNYLRAAHLSLPNLAKIISEDSVIRQQLDRVDANTLSRFKQKHSLAPYLLFDPDTPIHLAHALFDLDPSLPKSDAVKRYIPIYRNVLAGQRGVLDDQLDEEAYRPIGVEFLLENIRWQNIESKRVIEIYPNIDSTKQNISDTAQQQLTLGNNRCESAAQSKQIHGTDVASGDWPLDDNSRDTPEEHMEIQRLTETVIAFLEADSEDSAREIVVQHPNLLSNAAYRTVKDVIAYADEHDRLEVMVYEDRLALLRHCREAGIQRVAAEAAFRRAQRHQAQGHILDAIREYSEATRLDPDFSEAHVNLGLAYGSQGRSDDEIREYQIALRLKPQDAEVYLNLALTYEQRSDTTRAVEAYRTALRFDPKMARAYRNLGNLYYELGQWAEAEHEFLAAAQLEPDNADVHLSLGTIWYRQGREEDAMAEWKKALHLSPNRAEIHANLGLGYRDKNQIDEAVREFTLALQQKPEMLDVRTNLGRAYLQQGSTPQAIHEFQAVINNSARSASAHNDLGLAYRQQGNFSAAIREFQTALQIDPSAPEIRVNLALLYGQTGNLDGAIREFQTALKANPNMPDAHVALGVIYGEQGRINESVQELQAAVLLVPNNGEAHFNLALGYRYQGRRDKAIREAQIALRLGHTRAQALLTEILKTR